MRKKEIEEFLGEELTGDEYKSLTETGYVQELVNVLGIAETATLDPGNNPPDCSVSHGEKRIGIEHTLLIEPEVKKAQAAFDQGKKVPGFDPKIDEPDFQKPIWAIREAKVKSALSSLVLKKCEAAVSWKKRQSYDLCWFLIVLDDADHGEDWSTVEDWIIASMPDIDPFDLVFVLTGYDSRIKRNRFTRFRLDQDTQKLAHSRLFEMKTVR